MKKVTIIILNWNGKNISINCIKSLIKNTDYNNYKIIFVDNGSTDGSVQAIKKLFPKIDIIANEKNLGFPKGMNIGIRFAKKKYNPDYFLLLNNDIVFCQKNWLKELISVFDEDQQIGIANPILLFPNGEIQRVGGKIKGNVNLIITSVTSNPENVFEEELKKSKIREIDMFLGACFLIKKEVVEKIGLLDERYSPYLVEDLEYSFRAKKAGYKIVTVTSSKVIHLFHRTFKKFVIVDEKKDLERCYVVVRNSFLFSLEYLGWLKSLFIASPVLFVISILEKRNKDERTSLANLKFRKHLSKRIFYFFKSINDAVKLMRRTKF